jgi:CRP/FNR family transcriptional regulator, cyclic AMP receptor protein
MNTLEDQLEASGLRIHGCCEQLSAHGSALLEHSPLLEDMTAQEADTLGRAMLLVRAEPGQIMIREGEAGDWMMLILKGTVDVTKAVAVRAEVTVEDILAGSPAQAATQAGGTPMVAADAGEEAAIAEPAASRVAVLRPGAAIGEMSMLDNGLRYTTCTAIDEVEAGVLGRRAIGLLIRDHPTVGAKLLVKITQLMAQRLRNTSNHLVRLLQKQ